MGNVHTGHDDNRVLTANLIENNLFRCLETEKSLTSITKSNMKRFSKRNFQKCRIFLLSLQEILNLVRRDFFSALGGLEKYRPGHVQQQSFLNSINIIMEMTSSSDSKRLHISKKYENKVMMTQVIKTQGMRIPKVETFILY